VHFGAPSCSKTSRRAGDRETSVVCIHLDTVIDLLAFPRADKRRLAMEENRPPKIIAISRRREASPALPNRAGIDDEEQKFLREGRANNGGIY